MDTTKCATWDLLAHFLWRTWCIYDILLYGQQKVTIDEDDLWQDMIVQYKTKLDLCKQVCVCISNQPTSNNIMIQGV